MRVYIYLSLFLASLLTYSILTKPNLEPKYSYGINSPSVLDSKLLPKWNKNIYKKMVSSFFPPIHPLIPLTEEAHVIPCSAYLNEAEEFNKSLKCSAKVLPSLLNKSIAIPKCYIIKKESPDVHYNPIYDFYYINSFIILREGIVGFYDKNIVYIVENERDAAQTYRHELQHYFLDLLYSDGDAPHSHKIWSQCEAKYYTPSTVVTENDVDSCRVF